MLIRYNTLQILFSIILISTINAEAAESINDNFHGVPSYTIFTYSSNTEVNQGEKVEINLYISGVGDVEANKLRISIPPNIAKGSIEVNDFLYDKENKRINLPPKSYFLDNQFGIPLPDEYFENFEILPTTVTNLGEVQIVDPGNGRKYAPFTIKFDVDDYAPAGDYEISIFLFYKNESKWYLTEKYLTIHINYFYEKSWFHWTVLFVSILSLSIWKGVFQIIIRYSKGLIKSLKSKT